ncbi:MAG: hypothetical protein LBQ00_08220 [Syntrophobacterales bacterium]|jgi:uncharacterized protein YjcR|nr:hypothetical protein [Syntrophobacterales bacterium]
MSEGWLSGRKEIAQYLGILSWNTVRKWKRLYGLPIYADPAGRPKAIKRELDRWLQSYNGK